MADKSLGVESQDAALKALENILKMHPRLQKLVKENSVPLKGDKTVHMWPCSKCYGCLHMTGKIQLPDGQVVGGGFFVCDVCGHSEQRY